ncbi:hypothetical protein SAMN05421839_13524 [Halolactibacillus halophilus]|uniref:Uncharacterized protein n=2 Tax=Halolactibacillus halophilus TaxID=306540 RepID=A0A1I5RXU2_9BACI|nr:hypothetical protein [Halolactibacillus halophilus]GEM02783.1 hypothetical protein HHA03_23150 [Halolactibacillus halophilus]SFP62836.1 hypothetical protein SAMN05421839_13524 [Halolactibacillus halophilus]
MADVLHGVYLLVKHQLWFVRCPRNIGFKVRVKDRKDILDDFKSNQQFLVFFDFSMSIQRTIRS